MTIPPAKTNTYCHSFCPAVCMWNKLSVRAIESGCPEQIKKKVIHKLLGLNYAELNPRFCWCLCCNCHIAWEMYDDPPLQGPLHQDEVEEEEEPNKTISQEL